MQLQLQDKEVQNYMTPLFCFNQFGANLGMYVGGTLN